MEVPSVFFGVAAAHKARNQHVAHLLPQLGADLHAVEVLVEHVGGKVPPRVLGEGAGPVNALVVGAAGAVHHQPACKWLPSVCWRH